jgi:hypothetical protein
MTRKDYKLLAEALARVGARSDKHGEIIAEGVVELAKVLAEDNPRFDRDTFYRFYMARMYEFRSLASIARK